MTEIKKPDSDDAARREEARKPVSKAPLGKKNKRKKVSRERMTVASLLADWIDRWTHHA